MQAELQLTLKKYYEFWFATSALYEKWAKRHKLTANALFLLETIWSQPDGCTQHLISKRLLLPKQTVNSILAALEAKGYVQKVPDPKDKRSKLVTFTQAGQVYAGKIIRELQAYELQALANMGLQQRQALMSSTQAFRQELEKLST